MFHLLRRYIHDVSSDMAEKAPFAILANKRVDRANSSCDAPTFHIEHKFRVSLSENIRKEAEFALKEYGSTYREGGWQSVLTSTMRA